MDERQYERDLRRLYLDPMFAHLRGRLAVAVAADQAYRVMDEVFEGLLASPRAGVPLAAIQDNLNRMEGYNRQRVIDTFRGALGVDIGQYLAQPLVAVFMRARIDDNVDLVKTIPTRAHDGLKRRLGDLLETRPFDQQALTGVLRDEFKSSGYNLRRLCRDQTSKLTGQLNQVRQRQIGVQGYEWLDSRDERVRPTHRANGGKYFRWDQPPAATGHPGNDVHCRCVARAALTAADRARLTRKAA